MNSSSTKTRNEFVYTVAQRRRWFLARRTGGVDQIMTIGRDGRLFLDEPGAWPKA